jgi:hypothetical protein
MAIFGFVMFVVTLVFVGAEPLELVLIGTVIAVLVVLGIIASVIAIQWVYDKLD